MGLAKSVIKILNHVLETQRLFSKIGHSNLSLQLEGMLLAQPQASVNGSALSTALRSMKFDAAQAARRRAASKASNSFMTSVVAKAQVIDDQLVAEEVEELKVSHASDATHLFFTVGITYRSVGKHKKQSDCRFF